MGKLLCIFGTLDGQGFRLIVSLRFSWGMDAWFLQVFLMFLKKNGDFSQTHEFLIFADNLQRNFLVMNKYKMDRSGSISSLGCGELVKKILRIVPISSDDFSISHLS